MKFGALTALEAKHLPKGKYADGQGLWLVKRDGQRGKWVYRFVAHGSRREMGLGSYPSISLADARQKATNARALSTEQKDPILERLKVKRAVKPLTVKQAVESCFEARKAELKGDGEAGRWMSPLNVHILPKIGAHPIEALDQHTLQHILKPIWHTKPEAALKALNRVGLTMKHAAALGLQVDLQATMKAKALLGKQRRETEHIPAMPYQDAPAFFQSLSNNPSARALKFLLLTLARTTEVRLASVDEISDGVWTIPAERTKTDTERRVPLVTEAKKLLPETGHLFLAYGKRPLSEGAMLKLMKDRDLDATPHGFRATFRTWAEEQTDAPHEVKEACLGHVVDTGVVGAYQRSDRLEKRRALLEQWQTFLTAKVKTAHP